MIKSIIIIEKRVSNVCGKSSAWNANLLTTFSIYLIVYEQSLGFTNIIKHVYIQRLFAFQARDFPQTFNAIRIGAFDTLFFIFMYSCYDKHVYMLSYQHGYPLSMWSHRMSADGITVGGA